MIWRLCVVALARGKVQPGKKIYHTFWNRTPSPHSISARRRIGGDGKEWQEEYGKAV